MARRGGFLIALDTRGAIIGTAGFHALALKPSLADRLSGRYPDQAGVAQVAQDTTVEVIENVIPPAEGLSIWNA